MGESLTTNSIFFLFSSRLSDIEVKISFDLEVCSFVMSEEKQVMYAGSLFSQLDQYFSGSPKVEARDKN